MKNRFLEAGEIVNTHGIRGEVKIVPWCDSPEFLCQFDTLYIDGAPRRLTAKRVHKGNVIVSLEGVDTVDDAVRLKEKVVSIARADAGLAPGQFFLADLMGAQVREADTGSVLGRIADILTPPASNVYVVEQPDGGRFLIPAVPAFIRETNADEGYVSVKLIEGMMDLV